MKIKTDLINIDIIDSNICHVVCILYRRQLCHYPSSLSALVALTLKVVIFAYVSAICYRIAFLLADVIYVLHCWQHILTTRMIYFLFLVQKT